MISKIVLPIFFLYFVLISGYCSSLLTCGLQRFMRDSIYFKHFLIILSIYIFTFILNWYTFDSLAIEQQDQQENFKEQQYNKDSTIQLLNWFFYSLIIYIIFLISTKSEVIFIIIFIIFTIIAVITQIILKSMSSPSYNKVVNKVIITSNDYNDVNKNIIIYCHNIISVGFIITILLLLFGFYKYFIRQYKDHKRNWSTIKFIFGTSYCKNL